MGRMGPGEWRRRIHRAHRERLEQQRGLGMVPDDEVHPTDYVPRILPAADWAVLERGLAQRMLAINEWLRRLEARKVEVVPEEVIESSTLFDASIPTRFGDVPNRQMGFDIVASSVGGRRVGIPVIEDKPRCGRYRADEHPQGETPMCTRVVQAPGETARRVNGALGRVVRAASPEPDPTIGPLHRASDQYYLDHKVFAKSSGRSWPSGTSRARPRRKARPQEERARMT